MVHPINVLIVGEIILFAIVRIRVLKELKALKAINVRDVKG